MQPSSDAIGSIEAEGAPGDAMLADDDVVARLDEVGAGPPLDDP
jgi:hypothetical protein